MYKPFSLAGLPLRDMTRLYQEIAFFCIVNEYVCPNIAFSCDAQDSRFATDQNDVPYFLLENALTDEEALTMLKEEIPQRQEMFLQQEIDLSLFYYASAALAQSLEISCPAVFVTQHVGAGLGGVTNNDAETGRTTLIALKKVPDFSMMMETLSHEMRHAWQHEKHEQQFFGNYDFSLFGKDMDKYSLQPAEVDAVAYSQCFLKQALHVDMEWSRQSKKLKSMIQSRARKIRIAKRESFELLRQAAFVS